MCSWTAPRGDDTCRAGIAMRSPGISLLELADAHLLALDFPARERAANGNLNLGCGGDRYTNREVVSCVERVTGKKVPVTIGPRRAGDPPVLVVSSEKARREPGWKPSRDRLDVIVESAWRWKRARGPGS